MSRRATLVALVAATALSLTGCTKEPTATWHAAGENNGTRVNNEAAQGVPANNISGTSSTKPGTSTSAKPSGSASPTTSASDPPPLVMQKTGSEGVALTFDDGPSSFTPQILGMLREHGIKATFCLVGVEVKAHPDLVRQIVREGHTLCNHTWRHDLRLGTKSADDIRADLQATNDEIHKAVPDAPIKYFRHPGGNFTRAAVDVATSLGMVSVGWDVDTDDWNVKKYPGDQMTQHICSQVRTLAKPGSIVLSHDAGGDRTATMNAYRTLLPELKKTFTLIAMPV